MEGFAERRTEVRGGYDFEVVQGEYHKGTLNEHKSSVIDILRFFFCAPIEKLSSPSLPSTGYKDALISRFRLKRANKKNKTIGQHYTAQ